MATLDPINVGVSPDDGLGDPLRSAFVKINSNENILNTETLAKTFSTAVIVKDSTDFPAPASGIITLMDNTTYIIDGIVTITDKITFGAGNSIISLDANSNELNYTGVGVMFTTDNNSVHITNVSLRCATGTLLSLTDTAPLKESVIELARVQVRECDHVGTITDVKQFRYYQNVYEDIKTTGHVFAGDIEQIYCGQTDFVNNSLTPTYDLGTVTSDLIWFVDYQANLTNAASTLITGLADNGNLNAGGFGQVIVGLHLGAGTPFVGVSPEDSEWYFQALNDTPATQSVALLSLDGGVAETVISGVDAPVKVNAVWTINKDSLYTVDTNGRSTYTPSRRVSGSIDVVLGVKSVTGNADAAIYIAINGVVVTPDIPVAVTINKPVELSTIWNHDFMQGDYVEVFVANETNTNNLVVTSGIIRVL
tara:strand:- start:23264 stop:24532 length:1269 start_codon:yes stop_codon:yes gene_type:complete